MRQGFLEKTKKEYKKSKKNAFFRYQDVVE